MFETQRCFFGSKREKNKKGDAAAADVFSPHWLPLNGLTLRASLMKCKRGIERESERVRES